jgi:small conductance mechanosensitive channel
MLPIPLAVIDQTNAALNETMTRGQEIVQAAMKWAFEKGPSFVMSILAAMAVYLVGSWVAGLTRRLLLKALDRQQMDPTFSVYLANIAQAAILVLVIITALAQLGVPTTQFAALIAAAGLAIGLALQGNLSNFASGFLLVFFRPFKRGDYVTAGGAEGSIEEIGIFTTTLKSLDNKKIVVPNSAVTGGNITNFTASSKRLVCVPCIVAGSNSPDLVRASLLRSAAGNPYILAEPPPVAVITVLGENKFTMELRAWCPPEKYWDALFSLNEAAKAALDHDAVAAPVSVMTIHSQNDR